MPTVIFPAIPVRDTNGEPLIALRGQSGTVVSRGTTTPLTLVDVNGLPMAQPIAVTSLGFLPTFGVVEGLEEADFVSGAVRMPIDSPAGLRDSARESAASAAGARTAAEVAAGNASATVTAALSSAVASAKAAQAAAEDAAALVGAPADAAVAALLSNPGSDASVQLSATFAAANPTLTATYNPDGSVASITENGVLTTFTYNGDGTVATQTRAGVAKTFSYDGNGNVTGAN